MTTEQHIIEIVLMLAAWRDLDAEEGFLDHEIQLANLKILLELVLKHLGLSLQIQSLATMWQCICRAESMESEDYTAEPSPSRRMLRFRKLEELGASATWHGLGHLKHTVAEAEIKSLLPKAISTMFDLCAYTAVHAPYSLENDDFYKTTNLTMQDCKNVLSDIQEILNSQPIKCAPTDTCRVDGCEANWQFDLAVRVGKKRSETATAGQVFDVCRVFLLRTVCFEWVFFKRLEKLEVATIDQGQHKDGL